MCTDSLDCVVNFVLFEIQNRIVLVLDDLTHLCLTLSMRAAARLLVLSPSCLLQVGQWSTRALQLLQVM